MSYLNYFLSLLSEASYFPLSIIIVGVGDADFSNMDDLDCDDGLLQSIITNKKAQRDIVQFVPMNKFRRNGVIEPGCPHLAAEVLAEVPGQVSQWARYNRIIPNPDFAPSVNLDAPPPYDA